MPKFYMPIERRQFIYKSSLVGANLERADMRGLDLRGINLTNSNLRAADLTGADLRYATLVKTDLSRANLTRTDFRHAELIDCDLTSAYGRSTNFQYACMTTSKLRYAQFKNAIFCDADLTGVDFVCTLLLGARFDNAKLDGVTNTNRAVFTWWYRPEHGPRKITYDPVPGYQRMDESVTGDFTFQENSARFKIEDFTTRGWVKGEKPK